MKCHQKAHFALSSAALLRTEVPRSQTHTQSGDQDWVLGSSLPFKVASFWSPTGHEYQAGGAMRGADTELLQADGNKLIFPPTSSMNFWNRVCVMREETAEWFRVWLFSSAHETDTLNSQLCVKKGKNIIYHHYVAFTARLSPHLRWISSTFPAFCANFLRILLYPAVWGLFHVFCKHNFLIIDHFVPI